MNRKKRTIPRQGSRNSGKVLLFFSVAILGVIGARFFYISAFKTIQGHDLSNIAATQFRKDSIVQPVRGLIYDASGNKLAENTTTYTVVAILDNKQKTADGQPNYVVDKATTAQKLASVLIGPIWDQEQNQNTGKTKEQRQQEIQSSLQSSLDNAGNSFQIEFGKVASNLSTEIHDQIVALKLPGITFSENAARTYPNGVFASQMIGYASSQTDDKTDITTLSGVMGIEQSQNTFLAGKAGLRSFGPATNGVDISQINGTNQVQDGYDVHLTIDSSLQQQLETRVTALNNDMQPKSVVAVLMDAKTGQIKAATQRPSFDGTSLSGLGDSWQDLLVQGAFEPGSVIKGVTLAASIDTNNWNPDATFKSGKLNIGSQVVTDYNQSMGTISFREGFAMSSNVAFALQEEKMGASTWESYLKKFNFLKSTSTGLGNEEAGSIQFNQPIEQANTAFGQGITVTPMQLLQAYTAIAGDGTMLQPYVIDHISDAKSGKIIQQNKTVKLTQPIKQSTAEAVRNDMIDVVNLPGATATAYTLAGQGYQVAAKTGTAQIATSNGYTNDLHQSIHSIMALVPADNPRYIFFMAVSSPKQFGTGIETELSGVFKPVMLQALNNSDAAVKTPTATVTMPNAVGQNIQDAKNTLTDRGFSVVVVGDGNQVTDQSLPAGVDEISQQRVLLKTNGTNIVAPDFTNWSLNDVSIFANYANSKTVFDGTGKVYEQTPSSGTKITDGSTITVKLR